MRLLVGDEFLEFTDDELAWMYVAGGNESNVYQYRDEALKIYNKHCDKLRLSEEEASDLSRIITNRLLLPRRIIRDADSGEFMGYTTKFVKRASTTGIIRMKMHDFMDELDLLREDIMIMADYNVDVEDFNLNNTAYDGRIYLVDPGSYRIRVSPELIKQVRSMNSFVLNDYVKTEIFGMANPTKVQKKIIDATFNDYDYIGDTLRETAREGESVRQYVKRMTS